MWCHVVSQKCVDISETPTALSIMRVYNEGSKFLWDTGTLLLDYMALHAYYLQSAIHYLLQNQGISFVNPTVRGTKTVAIIQTGQHIK